MASPPSANAPAAAEPVTPAEFASAIARLGPWDTARRVAVAVSGGADSLALALLVQEWGDPLALIVDHGLRAGSAAEATTACAVLRDRGIAVRILRLAALQAGPGLAARAREARYAALSAACWDAGLVDLLVGHHAGDQAETVLMRSRRGSGAAGLAGMAALAETDRVRIVRPLLAYTPQRLRAVVAAAGITPADDPTNHDMRLTRPRLRREIGEARAGVLAQAAQRGRERTEAEVSIAAEMAARVSLFPEGYAVVSPGPVGSGMLAALVRSVSGRRYPVSVPAGPAAELRASTLAGVRVLPAGRAGPGWLLVRERPAGPVPARPGVVWDRRFRVRSAAAGSELGPLGTDAARLRHFTPLPRAVLDALPAFRRNDSAPVAPHLEQDASALCSAVLPAAGAPFLT